MLDTINLFLQTLIPKELQRNNFVNIVSNFLGTNRGDRMVYIMNNNKLLVDLLKYSFGDYYCYLPYDSNCIAYNYRNILKGKKLALIEQNEDETQLSVGYIHEITGDNWIYKDYKNSKDCFRINFKVLLLCKDYEKIIDKFYDGGIIRRIHIIKLDISDDNLELLKKYNLEELSSEFMSLLIKTYNCNKLKNN
jgi:hypothetical protein